MIETIAGEPDLQFLGQLYASITESLEVMEVPCLTECLMQDFAKNSSGQMKDYLVRLAERDGECRVSLGAWKVVNEEGKFCNADGSAA
jgi:hypothetical protein